jgi:hypothetical protein
MTSPALLASHDQKRGRARRSRDRERDRVVEHLPPGGDDAEKLVKCVAGKAQGATGLRKPRRRPGVGRGCGGENQAGDDDGDGGQPSVNAAVKPTA